MMQKGLQYNQEEYRGNNRKTMEIGCSQIELAVLPDTLYEGAFTLCGNDGPVEGHVISTDRRMECLIQEFHGQEEVITYRFHGTYLEAGEEVRGAFRIISDAGEYTLPYIVRMEACVVHSSQGVILNLTQFAALARNDWGEALRLFYSGEFAGLLRGNDRKYTELYRGLSANAGNRQNMEEFLVASGKKQTVSYSVSDRMLTVENPVDITELTITVNKENWGYTRLKVTTEGDFVFVQKEVVTEDDFLGNRFVLPVYIDHTMLRRGKNYGCVRLTGPGTDLEVPVQVLVGEAHGAYQAAKLEKEQLLVELMGYYQQYRLRKMAGALWLEQTGRLVERLVAMNDRDVMARLFQAQLLIYQERQHEGSWVLTHALELMEKQGEEEPGLKAYYLYLTTQINRDREYVRQITAQVEDIYRRNRTNWKVAWVLLFLSPDYYRNDASRLAFLEKQFQYGCTSPIWYLESLLTLNSNPALLRKLGEYEIQVLYYGARREVLGEDLKEQFLYLAGRVKEFSPVLLRLLILCYRQKEDERVLKEICVQLIKGGRTDEEAYAWYARGVDRELRITRLYEYYMMSMDLSQEPAVSRKALMYFSWQTNMGYEHTAYLYYYLLKNRREHEELFAQYKERMEHFVVDQILKEHINRHLAYLYQELLTPAMFSEPLAQKLAGLLFARMITVESSGIARVLVYRSDIAGYSSYLLAYGSTWAAIYSEKDTVLLEDTEGNRYACTVPFETEKLMDPEPFLATTAIYVTPGEHSALEFDKYMWDRSRRNNEITPDVVERGRRLVQSAEISGYVKGRTWMRLLHDYREKDDMRGLDLWLDAIEWEVLDTPSRCEVIRCLILRGRMDKARDWLDRFGPYGVEPTVLVRMCDWLIRQSQGAEDALLTEMAYYAFCQGKYDGETLEYLGSYLEAGLPELEKIRRAMPAYETDDYELCRRLLRQILFTGAEASDQTEILRRYLRRGEGTELASIFIRHCAEEYLAAGKKQDDFIFREIARMQKRGDTIEITEMLAYLIYAADNKAQTELSDKAVVRDFLSKVLAEGIRLNCFRRLKGCEELLKPWADKTVVEYRTRPGAKVTIHYSICQGGETQSEGTREMHAAPGGIFYREFVLFVGESLQYYFVVEQERQKEITQSFVRHPEDCDEGETGKFHLINEILRSYSTDDFERLDEELENLYHKEYLGAGLFTMR